MKLTLNHLRLIIREEVDRLVRRSAGFGGQAGIGGTPNNGTQLGPPGLGDEETQDNSYGKEQEKSQFAARVDSRAGERRQDGAKGRR